MSPIDPPASDDEMPAVSGAPLHGVSFAAAFRVWCRVALLSFGGPAGQIAVMHRVIVEERRWISERRFLHALNYCMLLPGPEAQQLATYIGWLMHGILGGLMAGGLFILPGVVSIMALSLVYVTFGSLGLVGGLFFGLKAAVLTIVVQAVMRLGRRALRYPALKVLAGASFVAIFLFAAPFPLIIPCAGFVGLVGARLGHPAFLAAIGHGDPDAAPETTSLVDDAQPAPTRLDLGRTLRTAALWLAIWLVPVAGLVVVAPGGAFADIAIFFSKMAVVTFGGAYAVLAYVAQQAVEQHHWLKPGEMVDGLGMAETTPGPLIMVLQFVGFLAAYREPGPLPPLLGGVVGGLVATWVTFTPCFLWIFVGAPFIERLRDNHALHGALSAITAAVVGVILNLTVWFAIHTIFRASVPVRGFGLSFDWPVLASVDFWALALSLAAAVAVLRFHAGILATLAASAIAGAFVATLR